MDAILEAGRSPEFLAGLRWGGIVGGVALLFGLGWRLWRKEPAPIVGLAAVFAAVMAMPLVRDLDPFLLAGLGLLALAGVAFPWSRRLPILTVVLAAPGAWFIGLSDLPQYGWTLWTMIAIVAVAGPVISWFDETDHGSALPVLLFAVTVAGVWVTVPDTEEALVLLGAMTIPTLIAFPLRVGRLGPIGAHVLIGLIIWVVGWGGRGREGSIIGAIAGLGMLVAAPLAALAAGKESVTVNTGSGMFLVVLHAVLVAVVTRIAGLREEALDAAVIAIPALLIGWLAWLLFDRTKTYPLSR